MKGLSGLISYYKDCIGFSYVAWIRVAVAVRTVLMNISAMYVELIKVVVAVRTVHINILVMLYG